MFERFTERARKVMGLANAEASHLRHEYIGTEHILLGLVEEGTGVGANVLRNLGVDLPKLRAGIEKKLESGPDEVAPGNLPYTPRAKKVIELAFQESRGLDHNYVGTEHLVIALIRERDGLAARTLRDLGLTEERVRREVLQMLGVAPPESEGAGEPEVFMIFDEEARQAISAAGREAWRLHHAEIGTAHVLFGILVAGGRLADRLRHDFDLTPGRVRAELEKIEPSGPDAADLEFRPLSPRAKAAFKRAREIARQQGGGRTGPAHLLFAILQEDECAAARALRNLGVKRGEVLRILSDLPGESDGEE